MAGVKPDRWDEAEYKAVGERFEDATPESDRYRNRVMEEVKERHWKGADRDDERMTALLVHYALKHQLMDLTAYLAKHMRHTNPLFIYPALLAAAAIGCFFIWALEFEYPFGWLVGMTAGLAYTAFKFLPKSKHAMAEVARQTAMLNELYGHFPDPVAKYQFFLPDRAVMDTLIHLEDQIITNLSRANYRTKSSVLARSLLAK